MTDYQAAQLFTNISTAAAKVVASNAALAATTWNSAFMVGGFLLALLVAVTWKG
jgi:hypothetical protein